MQFRLGLFLGFAIGYVLGAKAGRARYEEIMRAWSSLKQSDPAQQLGADVRVAASKAGHTIEEKATRGVAKVTDLVRGSGSADSGADAAADAGAGTVHPSTGTGNGGVTY